MFEWTYDQVKHKLDYIQYYKGPNSHIVKRYQANKGKKPGPQRMLSPQNELFLTLMKLRLNLNSEFLGHLFGISQSLVTAILSTWIPLLVHTLELKPLIHWPTKKLVELCLSNNLQYSKISSTELRVNNAHCYFQKPAL